MGTICNRTQCTPRSMYLPSFLPSEPLLAGICTDQPDHGHPTAAECVVRCVQGNMLSTMVTVEAIIASPRWGEPLECGIDDILIQHCAIIRLCQTQCCITAKQTQPNAHCSDVLVMLSYVIHTIDVPQFACQRIKAGVYLSTHQSRRSHVNTAKKAFSCQHSKAGVAKAADLQCGSVWPAPGI